MIAFCVNDPFVVQAWADQLGVANSIVTILADPAGVYTKALGLVLDDPKALGPPTNLGHARCRRFAAWVVDGVVRALHVCGTADDPTGSDDPSAAQPDAMLQRIRSYT